MVNGYVTLDLASNNIYKESLGAIKSGKPIMVVDAPQVYFADTIRTATIDDDLVVVITKGGKTITITDANAVSSEGDIQNHLYTLTLHYSDTNFVVYTNDKGLFDLDEDYKIVDTTNAYALSDELTTSLLSILDKINVGDYNGINYVYVGDESEAYVNKSTRTEFNIEKADSTTIFEVNIHNKVVTTSINEDWFITFKQLF